MAGTPATEFFEREYQVVQMARLIQDGKTYWAAGGGGPLYAVLLAKTLHAPQAMYITEDGVLAPEPSLPLEPIGNMVSSRSAYRALEWGNMNTAGDYARLGYIDYGILSGLQVDPFGNINSTWVGDYPHEGRRFGGPGGADSIAALCWRTIVTTDMQRRKFVNHVDFISSPGFLDGSPGAREAAGLPRGTGPWRVVTAWSIFDYEEKSHHMRLIAVAPFVTVEQVLSEMEFQPKIADHIEVLGPPTEEEITLLRTKLDVEGQFSGSGQMIVRQDDGTYSFVGA